MNWLSTNQVLTPFAVQTPAPLTTEPEALSPLGQGFQVELSRKGNVTNLSNSALAPGLPANLNTHAPSVPDNTPLIAAACVQPAHKGLDVLEPFDLPTPINSKAMARCLLSYDKLDASILLDGFSMGFPLHYDGPQCMRFSDNHHSALLTPHLVDKKIQHEIDLGRVAGPFQEIPFPNCQSSPLGLVPKHDKGKFRLIHDLSFPKGDSINFHTSREFTTVQYESLDKVVELFRACGHKCLIAKADIQEISD